MKTGEIIKNLRIERGWSQEKLAEMMGYSHKSSINKIEMGKSDLPQSKLMAFAKIFNVSPYELLGVEQSTYATNEQIKQWETKYNLNGKLSDEVQMIEKIQSQFGNNSVKMLDLFSQLNDLGQAKAIETVSDLTEIPKYTIEKSKYIYRVARSTNNADAEILERDEKTIEKLKSAKKITSDEDI